LIDFDFTTLDVMALYRISDRLLAHKPALEAFLYERERDLFDLDQVITLYDLTNTYFEATAHAAEGTRHRRALRTARNRAVMRPSPPSSRCLGPRSPAEPENTA